MIRRVRDGRRGYQPGTFAAVAQRHAGAHSWTEEATAADGTRVVLFYGDDLPSLEAAITGVVP